ncbi:MAG TPA: SDR family oxidoreductase [Thermoplasmatales archaeon]|nr:SDR family oxidoreductase [Thermoplasmatales archaeon]
MLKGKNAIITGASRGIGKTIAKTFAENHAFVGINYNKNQQAAEKTLTEIQNKGGKGVLLKADVSSPENVKNMINHFLKQRDSIDILVLNAGIYKRNSFTQLTKKQWDETIAVNLTGCFNVCKTALPHINKGGSIIFISSQLAFRGSSHGADYAASKAGILGLMKSLALELAPKNIRANAVAPGTIDTDIIASYTEEMKKKRAAETPLKRLGTPQDIANVTLFLASDLSNYITGETIHVNGGLYIH